MCHRTFGYYAHGVDETTAILPEGWRDRLVKLKSPGTMGAVGWCLEATDLAVSKLAAGRVKDLDFISAMLREKLVSGDVIRARVANISGLAPDILALARARLDRLLA